MSAVRSRRVRFLLVFLMLVTGVLGPFGHGRLHAGGEPDAAAWLAAIEAQRSWIATGAAAGAEPSLHVFTANGHHGSGDGPMHQHDRPDQGSAEHAHGVAFLPSPASGMALPRIQAIAAWGLQPNPGGGTPGRPDRPPRGSADRA